MIAPLSPEALYHACDLSQAGFETTDQLAPPEAAIGQERAVEAIRFGIGIPHEGYNLYVMGSTGMGRHTMVQEALHAEAKGRPTPPDWCYVNHFDQPHTPAALAVPAGKGSELRRDMEQLIADLLDALPAAFRSHEFQHRLRETQERFSKREEETAAALGQRAGTAGVALARNPSGFSLAPLVDGHVLSLEEFEGLSSAERDKLNQAMEGIKEELKQIMGRLPEWQQERRRHLQDLEREVTALTVAHFIDKLRQKYAGAANVIAFLDAVQADMIENGALFRGEGSEEKRADDPAFNRYRVNILVDNSETQGAPIVYEDNPTYQNLIGRVEHIARMGTLLTDFTLIKPGALHRANGGYLLLDAEKLLVNPFAWDALKRALRSRELRIDSLERQLSLVSTISLEPQPVALDLKVVLIGNRILYYLLKEYEPEFGLLFKVTADFAEELPRSVANDLLYARLIAGFQQREKLRPLERDGVALVIEQGARRAWDGEKVSLHLGGLLDLLREADYWAGAEGSDRIRRADVKRAVDAATHRVDQIREEIHEQIVRGVIQIDTDGVQLAQVNGLTVIQLGDHAFGAPTRITATARMGNGEVIDIEREIELAGPIHSKGVLILASYLAERYAKHQPLTLTASLVFEQTYGIVEGDSASTGELCALLSAIGDLPIRQSLAVTGSINQHGQVQAIGGVCEKIEGFFDICKKRGLTGRQGVIIPQANVKDLMLRQDVVEAAAAGQFGIYAVHHVEEAMELLTGQPAGNRDVDGIYPPESINGRIQTRLAEWIGLRQYYAGQLVKEG